MSMRFSMNKRQELVALYYGGESVSDICLQNGIPGSTFYTWLKPYQTEVAPSGHIVSANEFINANIFSPCLTKAGKGTAPTK
jgi:transposase-like protein